MFLDLLVQGIQWAQGPILFGAVLVIMVSVAGVTLIRQMVRGDLNEEGPSRIARGTPSQKSPAAMRPLSLRREPDGKLTLK